MTILFRIFMHGQEMTTAEWPFPPTADQALKGLRAENNTWIGVLRAKDTSPRLGPEQAPADSATYELDLQKQSGEQW